MNGATNDSALARPFRTCGACRYVWNNWQEFIGDPDIRLLGMQVVTHLPDANLFVFEHRCGTSISVLATRLRHLLPADPPGEAHPVLYGTDECGRHCRRLADIEACDRPCANTRDRLLLQTLRALKDRDEG